MYLPKKETLRGPSVSLGPNGQATLCNRDTPDIQYVLISYTNSYVRLFFFSAGIPYAPFLVSSRNTEIWTLVILDTIVLLLST